MEVIQHDGLRMAEVIRSTETVERSTFFSPEDSSMQFGLLAHDAGFVEPPHYHPAIMREIRDLQQMLVVQRGKIAIDFFDEGGTRVAEVMLGRGDAILIVSGIHSVRVLEPMQCVSVKQGPFLGVEHDKVNVDVNQ
jgi:hypothetical protein